MKTAKVILASAAILLAAAGCSGGAFDTKKDITVISREDGSGTRGAFIELFGIEVKDSDGKKHDMTTTESVVAGNTEVMLQGVAGDKHAIGYVSLGSINDTVKVPEIDGVKATSANVKSGAYKISRPFLIATKSEVSETARDFMDYILSGDGQAVVGKSYIPVNDNAAAYAGSKPSGKIVVAGSSSVTPIMEKLKEAYLLVNTNAEIEILQSDSTTGLNTAIGGTCDMAMSSRELKESESSVLTGIKIAEDGIAVIINKENPASGFTKEQIRKIFTGEALTWGDAE